MSRLTVQHYRCPEQYARLVPEREFLVGLSSLFEPYFGALPVSSE
jgi:hypothetical protein